MSKNPWWGKTLKFIAILLMGVTSLFTLAGGVGGICVAINPTGFGENMAKLAPMQWLYVLFVIVTVALGVMLTRSTVLLAKGQGRGYPAGLIALVSGVLVGVIHVFVSRALRGSSMPVDAVVYTTALTLVILLLMRIPPIWSAVRFDRSDGDSGRMAGAATLAVCGLFTLTVQYWAGPSHTWDGTNWADAWHLSMWILGSGLMLGGLATAFWDRLLLKRPRLVQSQN